MIEYNILEDRAMSLYTAVIMEGLRSMPEHIKDVIEDADDITAAFIKFFKESNIGN